MRGRGTALIVAALVVLAGIAVADEVRDVGRTDDGAANRAVTTTVRETTTAEPEPDLRTALADAGAGGVVYATVAEDVACELHAIALPDLATRRLVRAPACRFDVSPDERHVAFGSSCPAAERAFVLGLESDASFVLEGCSPAWRPDGRLTYVRRGDVVTRNGFGCGKRACVKTLVRGRALASTLDPFFGDDFAASFVLREIGWLSRRRLVAVVAARPSRQEFVAVFEDGRIVGEPVVFARSFVQLHVLPQRRRAAVTSRNGVELVGADA
ncbi:MAG: hypothetical protein KY396_05020, partial [Actinobacteria bacterium]|nr:hypothetical protein [Actinomycetota bacterium]